MKPQTRASARGRKWGKRLGIGLLGLAGLAGAALLGNAWLTTYVQGEDFRHAVARATAKGLKLGAGAYEPIERTGPLSLFTRGFRGSGGRRTMKALTAENVRGVYNPWGIFLDRWQLDSLEIERGSVELQKTDPAHASKEDPAPWPLAEVFTPSRVHLKEVWCPDADILWRLHGKQAGIYGIALLITPRGRDFEYSGHDGMLRMPRVPELRLKQADVLITKERLTVHSAFLTPPDPEAKGTITLEGDAGLREDRTIQAAAAVRSMPARPWLPKSFRPYLASGSIAADINWRSNGTRLETTNARGWFEISGARIKNLPQRERLEVLTGVEIASSADLDVCKGDFVIQGKNFHFRNLVIESKGFFRVEGSVRSRDGALDGNIRFGTTSRYLDWLPAAQEEIFTKAGQGYRWAEVVLSGTIDRPRENLSPRLQETLSESPGAMLGVFFRQIGDWFDDD